MCSYKLFWLSNVRITYIQKQRESADSSARKQNHQTTTVFEKFAHQIPRYGRIFFLLWNVFTLVQKLDLTVSTTFEMVKMSLSSRILCSFLCTETKRNIKIIIIYSYSDNLINESCFLRKKEENINLRGRKFEERFFNFVLLFSNLSTLIKNGFTARLRLTFACNIVCM